MGTKERIVDEALTLFSIKGFKGTSVKNIADAVGIKDSSLYKHFKSKKEIFDTIVAQLHINMGKLAEKIGIPNGDDIEKAALFYSKVDLYELQKISRNVFLFYLTDDFISRFWRMANMEQYQNPEIYNIFRSIFMEEGIEYQTKLFAKLMDNGIFVRANPQAVAMNFYAPIFFLLSKYAGQTNKIEEATDILDSQTKEFYRIYGK